MAEHEIREISDEEALEDINTLVLFTRQNPEYKEWESGLLDLEAAIKKEEDSP